MAQQPTMGGGAGQPPPSVAEQALGKGLQGAGTVASAGMGLAKAGAGKGLAVVKEMDPGQIGLVIKLLNIGTGLAIAVWAGVFQVLGVVGFISCPSKDDNCGVEGCGEVCCPSSPTTEVCLAPMSFWDNLSQFVISIYMVPLGTILILYELSTKRVGSQESVAEPTGVMAKVASFRESLMLYFGFIFFYKRRTQFLVFVGILCMGNRTVDSQPEAQGSWAPLIAGLLALADALLHFVVRLQHPEFDQSMQQALSAADDEAMGREVAGGAAPPAGGGGQQQYMPAQEDIYQAPSAPAPVYAPAAAPAPTNLYAADDGGTAI